MNEYENENELTAMTVLKEFHGMGKTFAFSELIQDQRLLYRRLLIGQDSSRSLKSHEISCWAVLADVCLNVTESYQAVLGAKRQAEELTMLPKNISSNIKSLCIANH